MFVVPYAFFDAESHSVVRLAFAENDESVPTLDLIPAAPALSVDRIRDDWFELLSRRHERDEAIERWYAAQGRRQLAELGILVVRFSHATTAIHEVH
jgi:hypothetical protein